MELLKVVLYLTKEEKAEMTKAAGDVPLSRFVKKLVLKKIKEFTAREIASIKPNA
jgi:hypothetical protein